MLCLREPLSLQELTQLIEVYELFGLICQHQPVLLLKDFEVLCALRLELLDNLEA